MAKATISKALSTAVKTRDGYICRACGFGGSPAYAPFLDCDHVQAESEGGATNLGNLQCLCKACNNSKRIFEWCFAIRELPVSESVWAANQKIVDTAFTVGVKGKSVKRYIRKLR